MKEYLVVASTRKEHLTWWLIRILRIVLSIIGIDIGFGIAYISLAEISFLVLLTTGIGIGLAYLVLGRLLPSLLISAEIGSGIVYKLLVRALHPILLTLGIVVGLWIGFIVANIAKLD